METATIQAIKCEICNREQEDIFITKNYKETGWNVCDWCIESPEKIIDALIEQTYVRDREIKRIKERYAEDMRYLHSRCTQTLEKEAPIMTDSRMELAFIQGYTGSAVKRI